MTETPVRPVFFVDRSLGRLKVPAILRAAGVDLVTLAEHFGIPADEEVTDVEWLGVAGRRSWPVLMKDARIRYRESERRALVQHGVAAFCLTNGNLRAAEMAQEFLDAMGEIVDACAEARPCLYAISRGRLRHLSVD